MAKLISISRKHKNRKTNCCAFRSQILFSRSGLMAYHNFRNSGRGLFINTGEWFWHPAQGFYGWYSLRTAELAFEDFTDYVGDLVDFDYELELYLAGY